MSSQPFTTCVGRTTKGAPHKERRTDELALAAIVRGPGLISDAQVREVFARPD